jgi:hypothetical protein
VPPRLWRERVADILDAVAAIQTYTAGMSADEFCSDRLVRDAVERNFAVIGEAVAHIPDQVRGRHPEIPWRPMRDLRNFIAHVYFGVNPGTI